MMQESTMMTLPISVACREDGGDGVTAWGDDHQFELIGNTLSAQMGNQVRNRFATVRDNDVGESWVRHHREVSTATHR